jgi:hypothetical protein
MQELDKHKLKTEIKLSKNCTNCLIVQNCYRLESKRLSESGDLSGWVELGVHGKFMGRARLGRGRRENKGLLSRVGQAWALPSRGNPH